MGAKVKVRSRKEIRKVLKEEIEGDAANRKEIASMLGALLKFCEKNDVQPETLLLELNEVSSLAIRVCMKKHKEQIIGALDRDPSPKEIENARKDFDRTLEQLAKMGHRSKKKEKPSQERPETMRNAPPPRSNEEMPYKPSHERPYYIH